MWQKVLEVRQLLTQGKKASPQRRLTSRPITKTRREQMKQEAASWLMESMRMQFNCHQKRKIKSQALPQSNDVALSSLLDILGQDVQGLSELGRKFASVEQERLKKGKGKTGMGPGAFGSIGEFEGGKAASSMMV